MNRTQRLVRWGTRAVGREREAYWVFAYVCKNLSATLTYETIAEQFDASINTIRSADCAYQLYADMRAIPEFCKMARSLRRARDKSIWEVEALHYHNHKSLPDAVENMMANVELSVRDYKDAADERYNGPALPRELARQDKTVADLMQDVWAAVDRLPALTEEDRAHGAFVASIVKRADRAGKLWLGRLAQVKDGLSNTPF